MACFSPQNFQLWLIATCFPYARDRFDEDRICVPELGFALCLQISLESRPTRDSRGLPELGFIFEFQWLLASWLDVWWSTLIIGCLKCTLKDIESQVLLLGPLSSRTQQRSSMLPTDMNVSNHVKPTYFLEAKTLSAILTTSVSGSEKSAEVLGFRFQRLDKLKQADGRLWELRHWDADFA